MYKKISKLFRFLMGIFFTAVFLVVSFFGGITFAEEKTVEEVSSV